MWTERFIVHYSKDRHYAVRWLKAGCAEDEAVEVTEWRDQPAGFMRFDDKVAAERLYNKLLELHPYDWRIEAFFSQAKWIRYVGNQDEFGTHKVEPIGETEACLAGRHETCPQPEACTCPCHLNDIIAVL